MEDEAYWEAQLRKGLSTCVSCGQEIEVTADGYANHHCPAQHEAARRGANTRGYDAIVRKEMDAARISYGFKLMEMKEDRC